MGKIKRRILGSVLLLTIIRLVKLFDHKDIFRK